MTRDMEEDDKSVKKTAKQLKWDICPVCHGNGKHVNPDIDSHGLTREDFYDDPDFFEDYKRGVYDVPCVTCNGSGKVQDIRAVRRRLAQHAEDRHTRMCEDGVWESGVSDWRYG